MVTVFKQDGLSFRVFPNDHLPSHVHVFKAGGEARIEIAGKDGKAHAITNNGLNRKDLAKAVALVQENQALLLQKWSEYHGEIH
ncbi:MAG: DUF4160 domain-containing protein [Pegethrix bostrychoides GSE-TBD4-15B]|jgi:hypothetical protein|uniref:DUF4160 domain-containing protein n=1 Tax=Pegethrix bostrychoides GSE-TBD4-15B TaxID=2839662 RepID=A0A951PB79_9CYAN|nr:DUF4160 domain-containing protein [Pegethrix bostrychoides GSE-TBD4-15B]